MKEVVEMPIESRRFLEDLLSLRFASVAEVPTKGEAPPERPYADIALHHFTIYCIAALDCLMLFK